MLDGYIDAVCSESDETFGTISSERNLGDSFPPLCRIGPHACKRIYRSSIIGMASYISSNELIRLRTCLERFIAFEEFDGEVGKAEVISQFRLDPVASVPTEIQPTTPRHLSRKMMQHQFKRIEALDDFLVDDADVSISSNDFSGSFPTDIHTEKWQQLGQAGKLWNLDRVDQQFPPLDGMFYFGRNISYGMGLNVTVYSLDTGVFTDHVEFLRVDARRQLTGPSRAEHGWNFIDDSPDASDSDGHGTHVAATAVGLRAGVAKGARVIAVKILDQRGLGSVSDTVAGLDWVAEHARRPAVVTLSLGILKGNLSRSIDSAVKALVEKNITVVVAAGNNAGDACDTSPASVEEAITVGASSYPHLYDEGWVERIYIDSNQGKCVDIFAPGADVWSACAGGNRCKPRPGHETTTMAFASGTSMAVPVVVGAAVQYLELHPHATPRAVKDSIIQSSTRGVLSEDTIYVAGTPNRMLMTRDLGLAQELRHWDGNGSLASVVSVHQSQG